MQIFTPSPWDVEIVFQQLLQSLPASCKLIAGLGSTILDKLLTRYTLPCQVVTYGEKSGDYQLLNRTIISPAPSKNNHKAYHHRQLSNEKTSTEHSLSPHVDNLTGPCYEPSQIFTCQSPDGQISKVETSLLGKCNALNCLSVWVLSRLLKLELKSVTGAMKTFKGVKRRWQILGEYHQILLVEDFAHHPTEVRAVLELAKESYPNRRILALFEPCSNSSRRSIFPKRLRAIFVCG